LKAPRAKYMPTTRPRAPPALPPGNPVGDMGNHPQAN
jgi:hypothetical protein